MNNLKSNILQHHLTKTALKIVLNYFEKNEVPSSPIKYCLPEDSFQTLIKFKEYKEFKEFKNLVFQIEDGKKKGYSETEIYDAVVKSVAPESSLRTYLERKSDLTLVSMSKILRSHFGLENLMQLPYLPN